MEDIEKIPASAEPSTELSYSSIDEELVGFDNDAEIIIEKLTRGTLELDVISIVGMAGTGKTALARKIYNSRYIIDNFDVQVWCSVSQIYNVRKLSVEILKQIMGDCVLIEDDPRDLLRKYLIGRRYLIVLDDLWELEAWEEVQLCFPGYENKSRIMVTTRNEGLARYIQRHSDPYLLPFLKDKKSWELLQKKVFQGENCPSELRSVGPLVAKECKGLPFTIIMIAKVLSRRKTEASFWLEVAYDISSHALEESMKMIKSSYDLLEDHLKSCLLYLGLFPKGYQIPVSDLLKWWIAEDFVQNIDTMELEETSKSCLNDLVSNSLVVVSKRRANGEMKYCQVHDLVCAFCVKKIAEEKFMQLIVPYNSHQPVDSNDQRLCMYIQDNMTSDFKERKSLEFIAHPRFSITSRTNLFPSLNNLRCIRVLHLLDIYLQDSWAAAFQSLIQLSYLENEKVETSGYKRIFHYTEDDERVNFEESPDIVLDNLKTLGMCYISVADMTPKFWEKFPNLEELRVHINEFRDVPNYLSSKLMSLVKFPSRLKDLSLSEMFLTNEIVSSIAKLQHLETLKLSEIYFTGEKHWDLSDSVFYSLRLLKLHHVFMTQWICSDESFPVLEYLVLKSCSKLEAIPIDFVCVLSLRSIKVIDCSDSVVNSAERIRYEIEDLGSTISTFIS